MTKRGANPGSPCEQARERMHAVLDGGLLDAIVRQGLDEHVAGCAACRAQWDELRELQRSLQALPTAPFPDDALDELFARTRSMRPARRAWLDWRVAAAAAALALLLWGAWGLRPDPAAPLGAAPTVAADPQDGPEATHEYTDEEKEQAINEARMALKLAAAALDRARAASVRQVEQVLSEDVSPALERVPVKLPAAPRPAGDSRT